MSGKNDLNGNSVRAWQRMLSGRRLDLHPLDAVRTAAG